MKLADRFITQELDGDQIMVSVNEGQFSGMVRSNPTAAFIIDCLKTETTTEAIVEKLLEEYDGVTKAAATEDVAMVIEKLKGIGAVEA